MDIVTRRDETREVTHDERKVIAFAASSDVRWFRHHPSAYYRVRLAHPTELAPYTTPGAFVLVLMLPDRGLLRFPLSEEEAAAARDAQAAITAVMVRAGVR